MQGHSSQQNTWQVITSKDAGRAEKTIACFVQRRRRDDTDPTTLPLDAILRHICQERIQGPLETGGPSTIRTSVSALFDVIGLLRAVQYDISLFNQHRSDPESSNDRLYGVFRLIRQCREWGLTLEVDEDLSKAAHVPGLDSLVEFVEQEYSTKIEQARDLIQQHGIVDFDSLGEYFKPGSLYLDTGLISGSSSTTMAVRSRACFYRRSKTAVGKIVSTVEVSLECVVATGAGTFAVSEARIVQQEFAGTRRVDGGRGLQPSGEMLLLLQDNQNETLRQRGLFYESLCQGAVLVNYAAGTFFSPQACRTSGRLMVDTTEAWTRNVHVAKAPCDGAGSDAVYAAHQTYAKWRRAQEKEANTDQVNGDKSTRLEGDVLLLHGKLPRCLLACTWPVVCGFSMSKRKWGLAQVEYLSPVKFNETVFDTLVLPLTRKRLVRALVTSHNEKQHNVDALPGKGEGIIFLLHGPSGCGKTLTAEAVSEILHRPLYRVSMGELGTSPESLETRLQEIFDLCLPWKALVLIDEAEMLLERRVANNSIVRNAMVCVMLRLIEYYSGILFLTTNIGLQLLDPAIASRLTCTLQYEALDANGRLDVWKSCFDRLDSVEVHENELKTVADKYSNMNGRQIKNAVQLVSALCHYDKQPITLVKILETLEVTSTVPSEQAY